MRKSEKMIKIEEQYNMNYRDILYNLYIVEKKSIPQISKILGYDTSQLSRQCKKFGIPTRKGSEVFRNWWEHTTDEEKELYTQDLSDRAKRNLGKNRDKKVTEARKGTKVPVGMSFNEYMKTDEYRNKISKANGGKNNGMYKPELSKEHRVNMRGIFGYKKWSKTVRERDNYTCCVCGFTSDNTRKLHAHHLEGYKENEKLRLDVDNGVTVCCTCHNKFHNRYRGKKTTREQFEEFVKEMHLK